MCGFLGVCVTRQEGKYVYVEDSLVGALGRTEPRA